MTWQEGNVNANGVTLHYYQTATGKPPVLLLHGITDSGLCWSRLASALENDYSLTLLDARGHGLSATADSYLPEDHVADIAAVVEALGLQDLALLGHSMGAVNAAYYAATQPDGLHSLLLEDPPWPNEPQAIQRDEAQWQKNIRLEQSRNLEDIITAGQQDNPHWDTSLFPAWAEAKQQVRPEVVTWLDGGKTLNSWRDIVSQIRRPTLLITGDTDVRVTPEVAKEAQERCPMLEHRHIPNAGHSIRRDQFEAYLEVVRAFLAQ